MTNFTPRAQQVFQIARNEAVKLGNDYIGSEHILLGIIELGQGVAVMVLEKMGVYIDSIREEVESRMEQTGPKSPTGTGTKKDLPFTPRVKKLISVATKEAKSLGHPYVGTEHLLLGLIKDSDGIAAKILRNLDVDLEDTRKAILEALNVDEDQDVSEPENEVEDNDKELEMAGGGKEEKQKRSPKTPALKAFGKDLTELAKKSSLDPVIGRSEEIERVIQILCRRTKNNPILIGEAGVGKTAIAEGLAAEIVAGNVPEVLRDKKIISLDMALMVAGTKYRGQFEERIKAVMDEIKKSKNVILFLDELHTIVGAGSASGSLDASNIFKPALSRGEMQCIGATTLNEYRNYIETDAALERRFQQVKVEPPTIENTVEILKGLRPKYEAHHKAKISDKALEIATTLSERYLTGRFLPDKAIDVMDEAAARVRIKNTSRPPDIKTMEAKVEELKSEKEKAISNQDFEAAAKLRDQERLVRKQMEEILESWDKNKNEVIVNVEEKDVLEVLSKWTGIPLSKMDQKDTEKLLNMESELGKTVIGQPEAITAVSKALRRSRADLKDPKRPIGSFMFLGPTGVGKTYLARTLTKEMFGKEDAIIQIDMSEYMEKHAISRLVGAPPGYVGHEEGGQLTEAVRRNPYSVILFDEVEKAHPDAMNMLLQILEEGRLTDSMGRKVDFRNTIVVMTSNVGAEVIKKETTMGFGARRVEESHSGMQDKVMEEVKKTFKPEFLNRIDELVVFHSLDKTSLKKILSLETDKVSNRLEAKNIKLKLSENTIEFLISKGYDSQYGARPMRRVVEKYIEDPLSEKLLEGKVKDGDTAHITIENEQPTITLGPTKRKKKESLDRESEMEAGLP
jgi:ATP-dependent Clp protease ATP-binding subunit ClpC